MVDTTANNLLTVPKTIGRAIVEVGTVIACPLLTTDKFVRFCKDRGLGLDRERLFRLERMGLFAPVFRVLTPDEDTEALSVPPTEDDNWFKNGWAWDTTSLNSTYEVPDSKDRTQEAYYSRFQIDHLEVVLSAMTLNVHLDGFLEHVGEDIDWQKNGKRWLDFAKSHADSLRTHEYRRAVALLCQFISNRYYPHTQGDQRTIRIPGLAYADPWMSINAVEWNWYEFRRTWDPREVEKVFDLTPAKLRHAYEGLAISQAYWDPVESWYQLIQFIKLSERKRLKGNALRAETLRSGAHMLRLLYKDLYDKELPHPNEATGMVIKHIPELEIRKDTRRYLELVVNRYGLNPQPTLSLIVEGPCEEKAVLMIFDQYFGAHPGRLGIEIIVLGGVDAATGTKEDRFRAIIRLVDYLHHHQTFAFLILDNERYARKLKAEARNAKSIHSRRYVTRPEYIKVWKTSFEFDNFSCKEIAIGMTAMTEGEQRFSQAEIVACQQDQYPGARLKDIYLRKTGKKLDKIKMNGLLAERMLEPASRSKIGNRPIIKTLKRVWGLAARNPFPTRYEDWQRNQGSQYFGRKHK